MQTIWMKGVALCAFSFSLLLHASVEYSQWSDSGIIGPKYSTLVSDFETLAKKYSKIANWIEYGKSVKGQPLKLMTVFRKDIFKAGPRPTFILSGSTHGNEYLNLEDRIPEELLKISGDSNSIHAFLEDGGAFVFIPILNPDGYEARERENAHGVDLNRDWDVKPANFSGFKETETKSLAAQLEKMQGAPYSFDYKVTVDYHCCIGAILYPWSYTEKPIPSLDMEKHVSLAEIADKNLKIDHGTTAQILGYYALGTTKDYYYSRYGATAFTFEGRYGEENKNLDKHVAWWQEMVGTLKTLTHPSFLGLQKHKSHSFIKIAD